MISDEALREFLVESHEGLDQLDRELLALERDPTDAAPIAGIFRTIHTIKGTSGFFGFRRLGALAHSGESLLSLMRDGVVTLDPRIASALLGMVDRIRSVLKVVEATGSESAEDHADLIQRIDASHTTPHSPELAAVKPAAPAPVPARPANPPPPPAETRPAEAQSPATLSESNVRVDVNLLDNLMNLVGELVLIRNQMIQIGPAMGEPVFVGACHRLNLITTELQEQVMKTRMQPIGNIWSKLPRVVRDLAVACGKQVRIEMVGKETELDRTIIEAIKDPLTHIVRNAIDHGLEAGDVRIARGKPRTGTLTLRATHEGGQVIIEVSDDGGGLDFDAIGRKAVERNLITAEQAGAMSPYDLAQLVFLPGFSTATSVTQVSGRGVGMDVVKTNIERIGGAVDLLTRKGQGTTLKIRIPLTLAIVPALIVVGDGGQRFAIPQTNLLELVRLEGVSALAHLETVQGTPVYRLRGQLLPLVHLNQTLGLAEPRSVPSGPERSANIIVLQADDRRFGLVVNEVQDTEEIVVKPLGHELKGLSIFAGATVMGDGRVGLILDVVGLAQHAGVVGRSRNQSAASVQALDEAGSGHPPSRTLLLFNTAADSISAIPLSQVDRLEEIARDRIEQVNGHAVMQYRGDVLPLIQLASPDAAAGASGSLPVIVYAQGDRRIGIVVARILDVVDETIGGGASTRPGALGVAIVQGRVTDFLDIPALIRFHAPWFTERSAA